MALPTELLRAVSSPGGGKIALVVGAGCSVDAPTSIPVSGDCSLEVHRCLLEDGVLQNGDCADPKDLSLVADAVFAKTASQRAVVERLRDRYNLKFAPPNDGYLVAAAMLYEGAISSMITLNFDLALSGALTALGVGNIVGVVECPEDLPNQRAINIYYLHRNANAADPESWVLRTNTLTSDWRDHWEPIVATKVLSAPVVVFAGLGTPVTVLIASIRLLKTALPAATTVYQVDPANSADSRFFQALALAPSAYIQYDWRRFMDELSQHLAREHASRLLAAIQRKIVDDHLPSEDVEPLLERLQTLGLVALGKLRAHWLLHDTPYCPVEPTGLGLIADLVLALAMMTRVSGAAAVIFDNGLVEFHRGTRTAISYLLASGRGYRGRAAIEAAVAARRAQYRTHPVPPRAVIVGGTSDIWNAPLTPPTDVVRGNVTDTVLADTATLPLLHISELRANPTLVAQVVP